MKISSLIIMKCVIIMKCCNVNVFVDYQINIKIVRNKVLNAVK